MRPRMHAIGATGKLTVDNIANVVVLAEWKARRPGLAKAANVPPNRGRKTPQATDTGWWLFGRRVDVAGGKSRLVLSPVPMPRSADEGLWLTAKMKRDGWEIYYAPGQLSSDQGAPLLDWVPTDHVGSLRRMLDAFKAGATPVFASLLSCIQMMQREERIDFQSEVGT